MKVVNKLSKSEEGLLKELVGKAVKSYSCDEFLYRNSAYMAVWINAEGITLEVHLEIAPIDYFGVIEDINIFSIRQTENVQPSSYLEDTKIVETPINKVLKGVTVVVDTEVANNPDYSWEYTNAIVFEFEDSQLVLEMSSPFSELIDISYGSDGFEALTPIEQKTESDDEGGLFVKSASRQMISI